MRYRDLVQFEPIETVIQLRDADQEALARQLVETYVVSDRMADQLANVVIPQLRIDAPRDNKGVLTVGNYGTGKSHLMSLVSAVAEYPELVGSIRHPLVRQAAENIAGRFKVVRVEIGGVSRGLRDILLGELEEALARWGTPYTFPPSDQLTNHKDAIIAAVAAFQERFPGQGILLVVDELLDYLGSRDQRALILDLGFLREIGEVAALTHFRFLGGVQETLFDNPRFAFVAQQLRRVRDRFEQVRIAREDIAFVVAERLLRKSDAQLASIVEHLRRFTHLYAGLAERLDEFARLFPIHPSYIATFERVYVAEKREVLKTFSLAIRGLLDREVPDEQPGLVSYDHYWDVLRENPSMRGLPGVADVVEKSGILEGRLRNAYTRPKLLPMALRVVHGLSVHRLTSSDLDIPLGPTVEELRDDLALHVPMPEPSAEFLLDQVRVALREIMRTVSGQYISYNDANGQYYLDLRKDIDFDAKIGERGDFMARSDLDRFFFDGLRQTLGLGEGTYVPGHSIWLYEAPWPSHQVTRPGYLFFGAPDERSTAQPPRDFYVYMVPPFLERVPPDEQRPDEVILKLTNLDQSFEEIVRRYAGARAMATEAATHREVYADKADAHLRRLNGWLRENLPTHLTVTHQGVTQSLGRVLARSRSSAAQSIEELLRIVAATLLAPHFDELYPQYPAFRRLSQPIGEAARANSAVDAVRFLAGRGRTNLALAVLDGLELIDAEGNPRIHQSRYANGFLSLLSAKPPGQVVNRGELIEQVASGIEPVEKERTFGLEPEWAAVVLLALVHSGDVVLSLNGREQIDASTIDRAAAAPLSDLTDFRFYGRPRSLPLGAWTAVFEGLGVPAGLIRDESTREEAINRLDPQVRAELDRTTRIESRVQTDLAVWNTSIFTDTFRLNLDVASVVGNDLPTVTLTTVDILARVRGYKRLLDELTRYNTVGRLRNLQLTAADVAEALADRVAVDRAEQLVDLVSRLQPLTTYLATAEANLPSDHAWTLLAAEARQKLIDELRRFGRGESSRDGASLLREVEILREEYVAAYAQLHRTLVLGPQGDDRRARLAADPRLTVAEQLAAIELLDGAVLRRWKEQLRALPACREFHEGAIAEAPTCPYCQLRPAARPPYSATDALSHLDDRLTDLLLGWRQALKTNLSSPAAAASRRAMAGAEADAIESFLAQPDDATELPRGFTAAATQALRGIESVALSAQALLAALAAGGLPCTVDELRRRFGAFLDGEMRGHDAASTRLTFDAPEALQR